ncbi:MAG TPA: Uma2 family endonuclease [Kofleriaceae bacterium]|nr:Uma2 family endonuclease [Kofleriaceae bacterium]
MFDLRDLAPDTLRPIRRAEYERMVAQGMFENERVELLYGIIVQMSPHGPDHDHAVDCLKDMLGAALAPGRARVRVQSAFAASNGSEPEPDIAVVPPRSYRDAHPNEAWLIVEVARTSVDKDRGIKGRLYAESNVEEYWIINLVDGVIETYNAPSGGNYTQVARHERGETVRLQHFPDVAVPVSDVVGT